MNNNFRFGKLFTNKDELASIEYPVLEVLYDTDNINYIRPIAQGGFQVSNSPDGDTKGYYVTTTPDFNVFDVDEHDVFSLCHILVNMVLLDYYTNKYGLLNYVRRSYNVDRSIVNEFIEESLKYMRQMRKLIGLSQT